MFSANCCDVQPPFLLLSFGSGRGWRRNREFVQPFEIAPETTPGIFAADSLQMQQTLGFGRNLQFYVRLEWS
jgi:hypothetical protein